MFLSTAGCCAVAGGGHHRDPFLDRSFGSDDGYGHHYSETTTVTTHYNDDPYAGKPFGAGGIAYPAGMA